MSSFTPSGSGGIPISVEPQGSTGPQIVRLDLTLAATEYILTLPTATKKYLVRLEDGSEPFRLAWSPGETTTNCLPVPRWSFLSDSDLNLTAPRDLYIQCPTAAGQVAVILLWT